MISENLGIKKNIFIISQISFVFFIFSLIYLGSFEFNNERGFTLFDDAMITMRYAYNFSQTGLIEWSNSSGNVEGLTNIGWMFLLSLVTRIFPLTISPLIVSLLSLIFLILGFILLTSQNSKYRELENVYKFSSFAGSISLLFWGVRGFEVSILFFIFCIVFNYISSQQKSNLFTFFTLFSIFCGSFIRDDFAIIMILFLSIKIIFDSLNYKKFFIGKTILIIFGLTFLSILLKTFFRYQYFGELLPNTYFLKVYGHDKGILILRGFLTITKNIFCGVLIPPTLACFSLFFYSRKLFLNVINQFRETNSISLVFAFFIYNLLTGGDAWEVTGLLNRFICISEPFILLNTFLFLKNFLELKNSFLGQDNYKNTFFCLPALIFTGFSILTSLSLSTASNLKLIDGLGTFKLNLFHTFFVFAIFLTQLLINKLLNINSSKIFNLKLIPIFLLVYYLLTPSIALLRVYSSTKYLMPILPHIRDDANNGITAFKSRELIPDGSKAVSIWAGTIPYFMPQVDFIDPLGKMDKHIARMKPRHPFYPGHTKWDWQYTLKTYKPNYIFRIYPSNCTDRWLQDCSQEEIENYKQLSKSPNIMIRKN